MSVPAKVLERTPLITDAGFSRLTALLQHPDAPRWNHTLGDRVTADDLARAKAFRQRQYDPAHPWLTRWLEQTRTSSWWFETKLRDDWHTIPFLERADLATRLHLVVPRDADFSRVLTYTTSGTTGHALFVPSHPQTLACNQTLAERALEAWGIALEYGPDLNVLQVCSRQDTYQFANLFSVWNQCAFAKINLREHAWTGGLAAAKRFIDDFSPQLITGDPVAFDALARLDLNIQPAAMFSTAVTLNDETRPHLERYKAPIIDWYSSTETGPIAFKNRQGRWRFFAPDLLVEVVAPDGRPVAPGQVGDIVVTGGRNPYLPLLRYRTGDRGILAADGRGLEKLFGRQEITFFTPNGELQGIDLVRAMRETSPFIQHRIVQRRDGSFDITLRPLPGITLPHLVEQAVHDLTGSIVRLTLDPKLGDEHKVIPFFVEPGEVET